MKGVVLGINPEARLVDLTHEIPPGEIRAGAFSLLASCRFFPAGTVHLTVVDPGVGSARKAIAVKTKDFCFVGPDNGVLSWALRREKIVSVHELRNEAYFLEPVSRTFHGRDVFAPAAAHLSGGLAIQKLGPACDKVVQLAWAEQDRAGDQLRGEVIYIDRFGNAITNIQTAELEAFGGRQHLEVWRGKKAVCGLAEFYGAVPAGQAVAVPGSSGFLEIAVNSGNASQTLKLQIGARVRVRKGRV